MPAPANSPDTGRSESGARSPLGGASPAPLAARLTGRSGLALFSFGASVVFVVVLMVLAKATASPFIFPAVGATAFLILTGPETPAASPRNAVLGYAIAIACGIGPLWFVGLASAPPDAPAELSVARTVAVALALALTNALMIRLDVRHPPASAATVMIALGMVRRPADLAVVELAVVALVATAVLVFRARGVRYGPWRA